MELTRQQQGAIEASGKVIVSAAAGSGKTFVMIRRLVNALEGGVDLDSVLAVTFTKKAAAQMKEKLRRAIIDRIKEIDKELTTGENRELQKKRTALKGQLPKIPSANISTIHSFCARMLRTYFYAIEIDGTFDIMATDDEQAMEYKRRAIGTLFENYYEGDDKNSENFFTLLSFYRKGRKDDFLRGLIFDSYEEVRKVVGYSDLLDMPQTLFTDEGFEKICNELKELAEKKYERLISDIEEFAGGFHSSKQGYDAIFEEMIESCRQSIGEDIFTPQCEFFTSPKPKIFKNKDSKEDIDADSDFVKFRDKAKARYNSIAKNLSDRSTEREFFIASGIPAKALVAILKDFEDEYRKIKQDENKLDYNDLEHYTLKLLENGQICQEIKSKYSCVFVDEYQDVNPVQEEIFKSIGGDSLFLVGDIKQAIYGFRGSESKHFREKYDKFGAGEGKALQLLNNFRSSDGVLNFVNNIFSSVMTAESCRIDYVKDGWMERGNLYPEGYGSAKIHIFGEDEDSAEELEIYSVNSGGEVKHTREALAVLKIVEEELKGCHYDVQSKRMVKTEMGDICILTRKNNKAAEAIVRLLNEAGYSVAGAHGENIMNRPEIRQMVDILSYIDNKQQDIPLATALLSPLGGLNLEELATIRVETKDKADEKRPSFRECCRLYIKYNRGEPLTEKLKNFKRKIENLRSLAEVLTAAEIIDKILKDTNLEAEYSRGDKLKNVRRLALEGEKISVSALVAKLRGGYEIKAPAPAASDSIKIMTMHASKGLEFPVVIISDVSATFRGMEYNEIPLSKKYGFAPKCFDTENRLMHETVLRKLIKETSAREELENELNLFYVACTRAMCNLHILSKVKPDFNPAQAAEADCYAKLFDMEPFEPQIMEDLADEKNDGEEINQSFDSFERMDYPKLYERINSRFDRGYAAANSVNLPVKSSASAILKMGEEDSITSKQLFSGEGETSTEKGIAYHRFLELCDFNIKNKEGIESEMEGFFKEGFITGEQREILDPDSLVEILNLPIFSGLGSDLYREQEFLCSLPANEILDTTAGDGVLLQGAIDLLARTDSGYRIIDYKYSHKSAEKLKETYSKQLDLYKKAVALITQTDPRKIETIIVNIFRKEQINL